MKISYDRPTDSLYAHITEATSSDGAEIEPGVVFDFDTSGEIVGIDIQHASKRADFTKDTVACSYRADEDIFQLRLSTKQIVREASLNWHSHISYAADESIVEIVLLDAKKSGALPLNYQSVL